MQLFHNKNPYDGLPEEDFNCVAATGNVMVARFPTVFHTRPPGRAPVIDPNVCSGQTEVLHLLCLLRDVIGLKKTFSP